MGKEIEKEPDFYPFRIKDHGWVLKKGVSTETIGEAFKDMVYELVTKDFTPGSIAESMHNDALTMIDERAEKARKAAKTRWQKVQEGSAKKTTEGDTNGDARKPTDTKKQGDLVWGSCENVYLTQDEFNKLGMDLGNLNAAREIVEDLSLSLSDGKVDSCDHFATLQKWIRWRKSHPDNGRPATFHEIDDMNQIETLRKVFSM